MITAPFNFVPLSEKVFFPDWAEEVSHDVPFEDAQSGVIDITMTAKSPIFVRDHNDAEGFCHHNGTHYIPGSSVKGMIRNVLEIMSFSKMNQINDDTYAVRDLSDAKNFYMKEMKKDTFCGWLRKEGKDFIVEDCGKPGRIKHEELDKIFNMDFSSKFKKGKFGNKADDKTALKKYELIDSDTYTFPLTHTTTSNVGDKRYAHETSSSLTGTIVLTGQPSGRDEERKIPSGKVYEFVFFESKSESKSEIKVKEKVMEKFLFAYFDGRTTEPKESPDWTYWKEKLEQGEKVPVFFQKNSKDIAHFGLSYLYKLPYTYSVKDGLPPAHSDSRRDMAETMFGYVGEEALKGRVQFSHFKATEKVQELQERKEILGTPRASYYPMYVRQNSTDFKTFMNTDFAISGWKRYPIHSGSKTSKTEETGNENVGTSFRPLKEGVVFQGKLRYHNLKKAELGALLSALTFHNTEGCFHNIGLAKALGYGKIALTLNGVDALENQLKAFEVEVSEQVEGWNESEQIKELLSMATEQDNTGSSTLKYMKLEQFANNKKRDQADYLRVYTELENIKTVSLQSLISEDNLTELRAKQEKRKENEKLLQEKRKKDEAHNKKWDVVYESTNIATIEAFVVEYPDSPYLKTANEMLAALKQSAEDDVKAEEEEAEAKKWKSVLSVEDRYKKKALEDFIANYPYSGRLAEAQQLLKAFGETTTNSTQSIDALASEKDAKRFKSILEKIEITESNKKDIQKYALELYPNLKKNKQKNFFKELQLKRYIGETMENELKQELGL
ncbi:MAG: TIGR03986 family CRISPR-associated RAMP protein [Sulfurovum sp.]|nr:TIGR03986 family CRISPR-associated RAMP protein [Sulfurovum sp.]